MTQESPYNHEKLIPVNYTDKVLVTARNGFYHGNYIYNRRKLEM